MILYGVWCMVYGGSCMVWVSCGMPRCWVSYPQRNGNEPENHWPTRERQTMPIRSKPMPLQLATRRSATRCTIVSSLASSKLQGNWFFRSQHTICNTTTADAKCNDRNEAADRVVSQSGGGHLGVQRGSKVNAGFGFGLGFGGQWRWRWWDKQTNRRVNQKKKGGDIICVTRGVGFCVVFTPRQAFK